MAPMRLALAVLAVCALAPRIHAAAASASDYTVLANAYGFGTSTGLIDGKTTRTMAGAPRTPRPAYEMPEKIRVTLAMSHARDMSATTAEALEASVSSSPFDVLARARLIGYYDAHANDSLEGRARKRDHVLWLVRNRPDSAAASGHAGRLWEHADGKDAVAALRAEWIRQVEARPGSTVILDNAAEAMSIQDTALSFKWLAAAEKLQPGHPQWAVRIGFLNYLDAAHHRDAAARYSAASRALAAYERAIALSPLREDRLLFLDYAAFSAYDVQRDDKAERFAKERLEYTAVSSWDTGNAVNKANTVLGLIALRRGDVASARNFLGLSGNIKGSPQLNSFGPDFRLAKALLEKGQRDAVDDYLESCARFWTMGRDRLTRWRKELAAGDIPDFNQFK